MIPELIVKGLKAASRKFCSCIWCKSGVWIKYTEYITIRDEAWAICYMVYGIKPDSIFSRFLRAFYLASNSKPLYPLHIAFCEGAIIVDA